MKSRFIIVICLFFLIGCKNQKQEVKHSDNYYTCSMHPQVHSDIPGKCPVCSMDLIPVNAKHGDNNQEIELTDAQIQLANISYDVMTENHFENEEHLPGQVVMNEKNNIVIPSRIMGRIEKLYFRNTGDYIAKGAKIYDLYSDELNTVKQEYLLLLEKRSSIGNGLINFEQIIQSSKNKLLLWGMTNKQIEDLNVTHKSSLTTSFYSPESGYISAINGNEGSYVTEGQPIFSLVNTSTVWVEAQVYTSQLLQIKLSGSVIIRFPGLNNKQVPGKIEFQNPEMNAQTKQNSIRIEIANPRNQFKPGMEAIIMLKDNIKNTLSIPREAIIQTNNTQIVWVKSGQNKFQYKMVTTGIEDGDKVEIKSGLNQGDTVVITGSFLLSNEFKIRYGTTPMAGMKM